MSTAKILVVGGGGGGGSQGGGGAGGVVYHATKTVIAQAYTITVGDGGTNKGNGGNSVWDADGTPMTALGGGAGGDLGGFGCSTAFSMKPVVGPFPIFFKS